MTDFIVVGNKNAMLWKTIFPRYFYKKLYFGYNYISKFRLPDNRRKALVFKGADKEEIK